MRVGPNEAAYATSAIQPSRIDEQRENDAISRESGVGSIGNSSDVPSVSFGDILNGVVQQANEADHVAAKKVDDLARGASDDLHGTMIATKEADISVHLVGSIRNKLLDAFQEIWRTSV